VFVTSVLNHVVFFTHLTDAVAAVLIFFNNTDMPTSAAATIAIGQHALHASAFLACRSHITSQSNNFF